MLREQQNKGPIYSKTTADNDVIRKAASVWRELFSWPTGVGWGWNVAQIGSE